MGVINGLASFFLSLPQLFKGPFLYWFMGSGIAFAILLLVVYVRGLRKSRKQ